MEDSILRREFDVGGNGEFDDGNGSSTEPNDMIEDELLEELQDRITKKPMKKFAVDKKSLKISK